MRKLLRKLCHDEISLLLEHKGIQTFENDMDILRCDEIPAAAVVIVEGEADVLKHEVEFLQISPGYAIGLNEVRESSPAKLSLRGKKNLKAIIISKFDFQENSPLFALLQILTSAP